MRPIVLNWIKIAILEHLSVDSHWVLGLENINHYIIRYT